MDACVINIIEIKQRRRAASCSTKGQLAAADEVCVCVWDLGKRGETLSVFLGLRPPEGCGQDSVPPVEPPAAPPLGPHLNRHGRRHHIVLTQETQGTNIVSLSHHLHMHYSHFFQSTMHEIGSEMRRFLN